MTVRQPTTFLNRLYGSWAHVQDVWTALRPVRFSLLAIILIGLVLFLADQPQDALISIVEDMGRSVSVTITQSLKIIGSTLLFCVYLWYWSFRAVALRFPHEHETMLSYRTRFPSAGLADAPLAARRRAAKRRVLNIRWFRRWLPQSLAYLAAVVVSASLLTASAIVEEHLAAKLRLLAVVILVMALPIWRLPRPLPPLHAYEHHPPLHKTLMIGSAVIVFCFAVVALIAPGPLSQLVGPAAVLLIAMCGLITIFTPLAMWNRRHGFPVVAGFVVILILANRVFDVHSVRLITESEQPGQASPAVENRPTLGDAALAWYDRAAAKAADDDAKLPLILVSTAGGGIRAAYWTATVLGHLQDKMPGFSEQLFAISGVSGGALGATMFHAAVNHSHAHSARLQGKFKERLQQALDDDFLAPALITMITRDLLPFLRLPDRAAALEQAWERGWRKAFDGDNCFAKSFLSLWPDKDRPWPALLLNGSVVTSGERIIVSNVKLPQPGMLVHDALDFVGRDVPTSTAVNHSARFPYIGPAGVMENIKVRGIMFSHMQVVDGGYFENNGATTTFELLDFVKKYIAANKGPKAAARIEPYVIQITSDPALDPRLTDPKWKIPENAEGVRAPRWFAQALAPFWTMYNTRQVHAFQTFSLLRSFVEEGQNGKFLHISMCPLSETGGNPGGNSAIRRPPLGWTLSRTARADIEKYLEARCNVKPLGELLEIGEQYGWTNRGNAREAAVVPSVR